MTEDEVVVNAKGLWEAGQTKVGELIVYFHEHGLSAAKAIRALKTILPVMSFEKVKELVALHPDYESVIRVDERLQAQEG